MYNSISNFNKNKDSIDKYEKINSNSNNYRNNNNTNIILRSKDRQDNYRSVILYY